MAKKDSSTTQRGASNDAAADRSDAAAKQVYEKPRLRRYDQIDQVKPYGPREL